MGVMTLQELLVREEELRLTVYPDSKGYLTIGVGRCIDKRIPGAGLSRLEALYLLNNDIAHVRRQLAAELPFTVTLLDETRRTILEAMVFQLGLPHFLGFHHMISAVQAQDWDTAADEMLDSDWARIDSPARAQRMAEAMRSGKLSED